MKLEKNFNRLELKLINISKKVVDSYNKENFNYELTISYKPKQPSEKLIINVDCNRHGIGEFYLMDDKRVHFSINSNYNLVQKIETEFYK